MSFISAMMTLAAAAGTVSLDEMLDPQVKVLCFLALNTKILMSHVTLLHKVSGTWQLPHVNQKQILPNNP